MKNKLVILVSALFLISCEQELDEKYNVEDSFVKWVSENHVPLISMENSTDNHDLDLIFKDIANYKVVALSEGFHNSKEMMQLHERMIKYLVENHGFNTVATETGLPESRLIYDYVQGKPKQDDMWKNGLNSLYSEWQEARDLIEWMRSYNLANHSELEYFGIDIGGFYDNWERPLEKIFEYLDLVDGGYSSKMRAELSPLLKDLKNNARVNYINKLTQAQRDDLARVLDEVVLHFSAQKESFVAQSNMKEYQWNRQSAVAMQLAENYYRNYMNQVYSDTSKYIGLNGREIAMETNLNWILEQRKDAKVILINHVLHTQTATKRQNGYLGHFVPAGQLIKEQLKDKLFVIGMAYGKGEFWNKWQKPENRFVDKIPASREGEIEQTLGKVGTKNYYINWEQAPAGPAKWLDSSFLLRENDYFIELKPKEWNGIIYLDSVSPATPASESH
ncbi:erythromycin esterase family protein [Paraglaciecola sp. 2405UD69-4]|uniref:erythromycin esterase family protein n=1 Tax=Paraglaciecola sp. 2405UD69-4 TaxID=3391836 RepID=UPI0039C9FAEC